MIKLIIILIIIMSTTSQARLSWEHYLEGSQKYAKDIKLASEDTGLPVELLESVICQETTTWNPRAHNRISDCIGLMGIQSDGTAYDIERLKNPHLNIKLGAKILKHKIKLAGGWIKGLSRYGNSMEYAQNVMVIYQKLLKYKKDKK